MNASQTLFLLLRQTVCGASEDSKTIEQLTPAERNDLARLADSHELLHIVGHALGAGGFLAEDSLSVELRTQAKQAVLRYYLFQREFCRICQVLESEKIPYVPLKGSVLRNFYPEPWMRTSCDIDILVQESQLDAAVGALDNRLGYTHGGKSHHDVSMHSPNGIHLELHFSLETESANREREILGKVWLYSMPSGDNSACRHLTDAFAYFYHIAHMAKHLHHGGCGIRFFLDLWILNHRVSFDADARKALLEEAGLLRFAEVAENLAEAWFSCKEKDTLSAALEQYVLSGGVFGATENAVAVARNRQGGRIVFLLRKVFPSYQQMVWYYPVLQNRPWLLPVCAVRRWFRLIFTRDAKRALKTVRINVGISKKQIESVADLMHGLELDT